MVIWFLLFMTKREALWKAFVCVCEGARVLAMSALHTHTHTHIDKSVCVCVPSRYFARLFLQFFAWICRINSSCGMSSNLVADSLVAWDFRLDLRSIYVWNWQRDCVILRRFRSKRSLKAIVAPTLSHVQQCVPQIIQHLDLHAKIMMIIPPIQYHRSRAE